jgi:hypothetical protein
MVCSISCPHPVRRRNAEGKIFSLFTAKILLNHETHERHETSSGDRPVTPYRLCVRNALVADTRSSATRALVNFHSWGTARP